MAERLTLPVLPVRGTVIFPGATVPITVGRPGTLRAIEAALKRDGLVFAVDAARSRRRAHARSALLHGRHRPDRAGPARPRRRPAPAPGRATRPRDPLSPHRDLPRGGRPAGRGIEAAQRKRPGLRGALPETRERAMELGERRGMPEEVLHHVLDPVTDPGQFADLVAGYLELPVAEKQGLLETLGVEERLRRVLIHVQRQIGMLDGAGRRSSRRSRRNWASASARCTSASS